ncbi:hypothetical protein EJB05_19442, partial [Eragrostis curvula]
MAQVWALSLAVASLAIGMLGVLGVWLCYLFEAVARGGAPPAAPPPQAEEEVEADDVKNGLSEAELTRLGGVCVPESADGEEDEEETLCPICLDAMEPGRPVRVLPGCNRAFHRDCVDRWLAISPRCPVCNVWAVPPSPATAPPAPKIAWGS